MTHAFFITGQIKKVHVSEPKDPKKQASAVILVQYGPTRESTGKAVEFINAVMVRVPGYKWPSVKDKLIVDKKVEIFGYLQGVYKSVLDDGLFTTELVADKITFEKEDGSVPESD